MTPWMLQPVRHCAGGELPVPRWQGTTTQRGLGSFHVADKKRLMALHRDGDPCWRCGQPMYKWQQLDRDHVIDRALGGVQGPAVLAHASCNRSAGARLGNQLQPPPRFTTGRDTICSTCGRPYSRAPRQCEICGQHYHPNHDRQRSCSRACGLEVKRRNQTARGWVPPAQRPRPAKANVTAWVEAIHAQPQILAPVGRMAAQPAPRRISVCPACGGAKSPGGALCHQCHWTQHRERWSASRQW